jgi:hypothetical protein
MVRLSGTSAPDKSRETKLSSNRARSAGRGSNHRSLRTKDCSRPHGPVETLADPDEVHWRRPGPKPPAHRSSPATRTSPSGYGPPPPNRIPIPTRNLGASWTGLHPSRYHPCHDDSSKSDAPTIANGSIHSCSVIHRGSLQIRSTGRARLESSIRGLARDGTGIPGLECLSNALFKLPEAAGLGCASLDPSPHRDRGRLPALSEL